MRLISAEKIKSAVAELCLKANLVLSKDVLRCLSYARRKETRAQARLILDAIIRNALIASKDGLAICQDTGMPIVFIELGQDVMIKGSLKNAVNRGVEQGYRRGSLRNSIVKDPLARGVSGYAPAVVHVDLVKGSRIKLTVLPKGFGCENKSSLKMFNPTASLQEISRFIIDTVKAAGPDACPPYIVGVGIGGTADYASFLAKKALLRRCTPQRSERRSKLGRLEIALLKEINKLKIGPMGLGGRTTALAINIETYPTHIAGLPVAVNISCHALRSATRTL
ncbi:MAG: fumarate hydratase [Candidatus Omnitrophica bacterium]|nr:fumarate hydratase [Candidatus Omnitrophota bacterium]